MRSHPKGGVRGQAKTIATILALGLGLVALGDEAKAQENPAAPIAGDSSNSALSVVESACPKAGVRASDLEAVRYVNTRMAVDQAMKDAELEAAQRELDELYPERRYERPSNPEEARLRVHAEYGPDSFLTRSVSTVAAIANAAERSSTASIDGVAGATETLVNRSGSLLGFDTVSVPRISPKLSGRRAGMYLKKRW